MQLDNDPIPATSTTNSIEASDPAVLYQKVSRR